MRRDGLMWNKNIPYMIKIDLGIQKLIRENTQTQHADLISLL
jgi:hypothetical protein